MLRNNPELNITEISDKIGFSSSRYFSKCFKDVYQISPLAYRKGENMDSDERTKKNRLLPLNRQEAGKVPNIHSIRVLYVFPFTCTLLYTEFPESHYL